MKRTHTDRRDRKGKRRRGEDVSARLQAATRVELVHLFDAARRTGMDERSRKESAVHCYTVFRENFAAFETLRLEIDKSKRLRKQLTTLLNWSSAAGGARSKTLLQWRMAWAQHEKLARVLYRHCDPFFVARSNESKAQREGVLQARNQAQFDVVAAVLTGAPIGFVVNPHILENDKLYHSFTTEAELTCRSELRASWKPEILSARLALPQKKIVGAGVRLAKEALRRIEVTVAPAADKHSGGTIEFRYYGGTWNRTSTGSKIVMLQSALPDGKTYYGLHGDAATLLHQFHGDSFLHQFHMHSLKLVEPLSLKASALRHYLQNWELVDPEDRARIVIDDPPLAKPPSV